MAGNEEDLGMCNLYKSMFERGPNKRRIKPLENNLMQLTFGVDSEDDDSDCDFQISGHVPSGSDSDASDEHLVNGESSVKSHPHEEKPSDSATAVGKPVDRLKQTSRDCGTVIESISDLSEEDVDEESAVSTGEDDADDEDNQGGGSSATDDVDSEDAGGDDDDDEQIQTTTKFLEESFGSDDSDSSFCPADNSDDGREEMPMEKRFLRRKAPRSAASSSVGTDSGGGGGDGGGGVGGSSSGGLTLGDLIDAMKMKAQAKAENKKAICAVCLSISSTKDDGEMLECDKCGCAVHEGCFGLGVDSSSCDSSDGDDAASTASRLSIEPWFCDACRSNATPYCVLCLAGGPGIYKPTHDGRWIHIVCTLYTPGVQYGHAKRLSPVLIHNIAASRWDSKRCDLCEDEDRAQRGVCISCDAGLCKTRFHVTCAQRHGLLCEAPSDEVVADPFFALCRQHSDKSLAKTKARCYAAMIARIEQHQFNKEDLTSGLRKAQKRYLQRAPVRLAWRPKPGEAVQVATDEVRQPQPVALSLERVPPSFSGNFLQYYHVRHLESEFLEDNISKVEKAHASLLEEQKVWEAKLDEVSVHVRGLRSSNSNLRSVGRKLLESVATVTQKPLRVPAYLVEDVLAKQLAEERKQEAEKEAAAQAAAKVKAEQEKKRAVEKTPKHQGRPRLKVGSEKDDTIHMCCVCKKMEGQDTMIDCDMCHCYYHLKCCDPPLLHMPKKTTLCGWQCTACDTSDSDFYWKPSEHKSGEAGVSTKRGRRVQQPQKFDSSLSPKKKKAGPSAGRKRKRLSSTSTGNTPKPKKVRQPKERKSAMSVKKEADVRTLCCVCKGSGDNSTLVRCDECRHCYHFQCLDPPVKSNPKSRGYIWRCTKCDSSCSDSDQVEEDGHTDCEDGNEEVLEKAETVCVKD